MLLLILSGPSLAGSSSIGLVPMSLFSCALGPYYLVPSWVRSVLATNSDIWRLLVGGKVLMGFGITVSDSAQEKFFYHWFGAGGLTFVFGFENAIAKTTSLVSGITAISTKEATGWYGYSFWIPVGLCAAPFCVAVGYIISERFVIPKPYRILSGRALVLENQGL
jgi:hypothetical protein